MALTRTALNAIIAAYVNDSGDDESGTEITKEMLDALSDAIADAVDVALGTWTDVAFAAGNFTANGSMTWTVASGDVTRNRYKVNDKELHWQVMVGLSTVGGTPNTELRIAIPTGTFQSVNQVFAVAYVNDNGTIREAYAQPSSTGVLAIRRKDGVAWTASTDNTYIYFDLTGELA